MDWLLTNPQIHSTFASLGTIQNDQYIISENCLSILDEINCKLLIEDHTLRTFRRAIGYGQNVKNDLIPLLLNVKCHKIIDSCIRILVNLTVPVECLVNVDIMIRTETGRHTIYELNKLLISCKEIFTDVRTTKSIIDFMKQILEKEVKISLENCDSINNCLLLLRNILHIPESNSYKTSMQNQLVWNLFTQSIDKLLLYLMSCTQKSYWGVTMVQLIALMYKDQHVNTLQKLLNIWFESSLSDSSEDNESNTSPPKQFSGDSSPMLTSDPTSDSSDNGGSGKSGSNDESFPGSSSHSMSEQTESKQFARMSRDDSFQSPIMWAKPSKHLSNKGIGGAAERVDSSMSSSNSNDSTNINSNSNSSCSSKSRSKKQTMLDKKCEMNPSSQSELSDCGYGTQVENQESISTSSNDDENPKEKPVHHPPCNQKQRYNPARSSNITTQDKKEWRRKKIVKRSRSNLINMKGLLHHTPTDEDISNILKEFTVDFLLKGYGNLVQELYNQLLTDIQVQVDTSHFFWLVTYFLKFAAQLELELEHVCFVLSFEVVSYLTYEGVSLCEQLELASKHQGNDLKPCLRRMHLVVTAIREFLQAIDTYKRVQHLSLEDKEHLKVLQCQIGATNDLKSLFILLLRRYNPSLQSKQYLQDLIITNHILLLLLDGVSKFPEFNGTIKMMDHISHFATVEIMYKYGLLLEDFRENGEFVNDCIFTMMHHIGGDLGQSSTLFQPIILKTYSQIWETEYELCDDWSDLIEYVIHKFINTPQPAPMTLSSSTFNIDETMFNAPSAKGNLQINWTQENMDNLYWYYVQSKKSPDVVGKIINSFQDNGNHYLKSRLAVIQQLLQQDIINFIEYDELMRSEDVNFERSITTPTATIATDPESGIEIKDFDDQSVINKPIDDIQVLRDRLLKENKGEQIIWLQQILIECCFVKLYINCEHEQKSTKHVNFQQKIHVLEPVPHHCIAKKQSIPVVPWTSEQSNILNYQPFVLLLHKLGFHLPADAGKLFVRIPDFWTADILYSVALKLGPLDKSLFKFDESQLNKNNQPAGPSKQQNTIDIRQQTNNHNSSSVVEVTNSFGDYFAIPRIKKANAMIRYTPDLTPATPTVPNWLQIVMKSKEVADQSIHHLSAIATTVSTNLLKTTASIVSTRTFEALNVDVFETDEIIVPPPTGAITTNTTSITLSSSNELPLLRTSHKTLNHSKNSLFNLLLKPVSPTTELCSDQPYRMTNNNNSLLKIVDNFSCVTPVLNMNNTEEKTTTKPIRNGVDSEPIVGEVDVESNCGSTTASDLTRMYVSDEEDKSVHEEVIVQIKYVN